MTMMTLHSDKKEEEITQYGEILSSNKANKFK